MNFQKLIYSVLKNPIVYWTYQKLVGGDRARILFLKNHVNAQPNSKFLDIGCGPGNMIDFLPELNYHGVDINPEYIKAAKEQYGTRGTFTCADLNDFGILEPETFDIVMASGVIHHLDDDLSKKLFQVAHKALKPNGKLITFDGCYRKGQNPFAKLMLKLDRGKYVRTQDQYETLALGFFQNIKSEIDETYFKIPYTSLIMTCKK
ncbi:MAG TPA: class I SAM-dependent methyltransferase [Flavobacteriaceae bacterium]|nr:class I SAM-dependent methyltransferase [Flavobacteriaceae bacterium]